MTERRRAERSLQESRQELRALSGRLFLAQEEERKRISRELHDDLSQKVALLAFDTSSLVLTPPPSPAEMKSSATFGRGSRSYPRIFVKSRTSCILEFSKTSGSPRLCVSCARSSRGERELKWYLSRRRCRKLCRWTSHPACTASHKRLCTTFQKHARASQVRLTVSGNPECISLWIQDDGVGFDSEGPHPGTG